MVMLLSIFTLQLKSQTCPGFEFCLDGPYYDPFSGQFTVDVFLEDFNTQLASGINLDIDFTPSSLPIDQVETEASLNALLDNLNTSFTFTGSSISLTGIDVPLDEGHDITSNDFQYLFTIYFVAHAGTEVTFEFGSDHDLIVAFPNIPDYEICESTISSGCEIIGFEIEGYELSGIIESPVHDCDDAFDGGVPDVTISIEESNQVIAYGCEDQSGLYGEYGCSVVADLDYRITPYLNDLPYCGITSLDWTLYRNFLLGYTCLDYLWQSFAGDIDQNGYVDAYDLLEIQRLMMETYPVSTAFTSWKFVPASTYNAILFDECEDDVPSYNPYIDIPDVDEDIDQLDFVAIKMGDGNGTCTDCYETYTIPDEELLVRATPEIVKAKLNQQGILELSFDRDIQHVDMINFSIKAEEPLIMVHTTFKHRLHFLSFHRDGYQFFSYGSMEKNGESFVKNETFIALTYGGLPGKEIHNPIFPNEMIINNEVIPLAVQTQTAPTTMVNPNPAHHQFKIHSTLCNEHEVLYLQVMNTAGQIIYYTQLHCSDPTVQLTLGPGIYTYKVMNRHGQDSGKLIIN